MQFSLPSLLSAGAALLLATPAAAAAASSAGSTTTATTEVVLTIPASPFLANPNTLSASTTHGTLTALGRPALRAALTPDNTLVFRNVTPGSYLADVHCAAYGFAPLRVDVLAVEDGAAAAAQPRIDVRAWETYRGNEWENRGEEARPVGEKAAFPVRCLGHKVFFQERGKFSILTILKNPMILLGLVSMGIFIGMPKLVENMDPEMRAEWEEQQKNNPMNSIMGGGKSGGNFDMAAFLSGSNGPQAGDSNDAGSGGNGGGKKGGKR